MDAKQLAEAILDANEFMPPELQSDTVFLAREYLNLLDKFDLLLKQVMERIEEEKE